MEGVFPDKVQYDLLLWKPDTKHKSKPNDPQIPKQKTDTGLKLGSPDLERREKFKRVLMSSVIKLHKKQVEDRNVCRSFCNETTAVSQLLRRLTQSLIAQEEKKWPLNTFPIIKDFRLVVRRIEQMNTYIQEAMEDKASAKNLYKITNKC
jgi:ribosomal protein S15P/S13E